MATTYTKCGAAEYDLLRRLIAEHRRDLQSVEVRITLLFASPSKPGKPALKHHGNRVLGRCQVNSPQDKAEGKGDATITLDADYSIPGSSSGRATGRTTGSTNACTFMATTPRKSAGSMRSSPRSARRGCRSIRRPDHAH